MGGCKVGFVEDYVGPAAEAAVKAMKDSRVLLLENLQASRRRGGKTTLAFRPALAALADIYVNDAFSCAHRAHASTVSIAHLLPAAAGRLMQAELDHLSGS